MLQESKVRAEYATWLKSDSTPDYNLFFTCVLPMSVSPDTILKYWRIWTWQAEKRFNSPVQSVVFCEHHVLEERLHLHGLLLVPPETRARMWKLHRDKYEDRLARLTPRELTIYADAHLRLHTPEMWLVHTWTQVSGGRARVEQIESIGGVSGYVTKYVLKSFTSGYAEWQIHVSKKPDLRHQERLP